MGGSTFSRFQTPHDSTIPINVNVLLPLTFTLLFKYLILSMFKISMCNMIDIPAASHNNLSSLSLADGPSSWLFGSDSSVFDFRV